MDMAKEVTRIQFAQYGMLNVPDDMLDNYAKEMLKRKDSVEQLVNRSVESKLAKALKESETEQQDCLCRRLQQDVRISSLFC